MKIFKLLNKKNLIALILSIGCMIFAIANIFIKSEPIRMGIWVVIIIVFALDYIALMDEWMKKKRRDLQQNFRTRKP